MRRAMNPIELTCAYIFTMDLKTFVSVSIDIKTILMLKKGFFFSDFNTYTLFADIENVVLNVQFPSENEGIVNCKVLINLCLIKD